MTPLALTIGDPSGIGPEIVAKAWSALGHDVPMVAIGDADVLAAEGIPVRIVDRPLAAERALAVLHMPVAERPEPGRAQPANAAATIRWIETAARLAGAGAVSGMVTAPITKKVLVEGAGFAYPGHTEFLAALDGKTRSVMMLACPDLRVVPVTIHIALSDVPRALDRTLVADTIRITHAALRRDFGLENPRLAVAGLNPHAGEGGLMGREEIEMLGPLVQSLREEGLAIAGPLSADTMFHAAARRGYDVAICMYHDQALIPVKTLGFEEGVNVTLGLGFIRTSPDHGTAYDIAGKGEADPRSMIAAIRMAGEMAARRRG